MFLAFGSSGLRIVSDDGVAWRDQQLGAEGEVWRAIASSPDRIAAVGSFGADVMFGHSTDGISWTISKRANARPIPIILRGLAFGAGRFVAVGGEQGAVVADTPSAAVSSDGVSWSELKPIGGSGSLRRVAFGAGKFVGVGDFGRRSVSTDGETWRDQPNAKASDTLIDVAFGNGRFVGVGLHGLRVSSEDGLRWSSPVRGQEGEHLNSIVWIGDQFVAVGLGATFRSPDGRDWERITNANAPLATAYGKGTFIGSRWKGRLMVSSNAADWREVHKCARHVEALAFV